MSHTKDNQIIRYAYGSGLYGRNDQVILAGTPLLETEHQLFGNITKSLVELVFHVFEYRHQANHGQFARDLGKSTSLIELLLSLYSKPIISSILARADIVRTVDGFKIIELNLGIRLLRCRSSVRVWMLSTARQSRGILSSSAPVGAPLREFWLKPWRPVICLGRLIGPNVMVSSKAGSYTCSTVPMACPLLSMKRMRTCHMFSRGIGTGGWAKRWIRTNSWGSAPSIYLPSASASVLTVKETARHSGRPPAGYSPA
jgi:hypothetical protein